MWEAPSPACIHINIECTDRILSCPAGTPAYCHFGSPQLPVYFTALCVCFGACRNVLLLCPKQLVVSLNPPCVLSVINRYAVSVRDFFHCGNPFLLSNCPLCFFFLPPLRTSEGSFSFCTCSLLSHQRALKDQTLLLSLYHFYRSLTTCYYFVRLLFLSPSLIPTSPSRLAYSINSKLSSMLSTCPPVSPISIPPILSTSASLPCFLTPGRTTVRLRGGGGTR